MNQVLPSKTHQVDSKQDYGPLVQTNLTLKIIHRVVKLILPPLDTACIADPSVYICTPASVGYFSAVSEGALGSLILGISWGDKGTVVQMESFGLPCIFHG